MSDEYAEQAAERPSVDMTGAELTALADELWAKADAFDPGEWTPHTCFGFGSAADHREVASCLRGAAGHVAGCAMRKRLDEQRADKERTAEEHRAAVAGTATTAERLNHPRRTPRLGDVVAVRTDRTTISVGRLVSLTLPFGGALATAQLYADARDCYGITYDPNLGQPGTYCFPDDPGAQP